MIGDLIRQVRDLSLDLRPSMLDDLGLLPALKSYLKRYSSRTGIKAKFNNRGIRKRFAPAVETAVYRIVQEALTNVARHAGVSEARVSLYSNRERILL